MYWLYWRDRQKTCLLAASSHPPAPCEVMPKAYHKSGAGTIYKPGLLGFYSIYPCKARLMASRAWAAFPRFCLEGHKKIGIAVWKPAMPIFCGIKTQISAAKGGFSLFLLTAGPGPGSLGLFCDFLLQFSQDFFKGEGA